jgi:capsular exopolysaccharide synthesis family protein
MEENKVAKFFLNHLTVSPRRDSMIIDVSFISPSRQLSQDAVNRLMTEFISWKMDQKVTSSGTAREYLMKQIDRAKINLEESEEKQNQFARKAGIVSMDSRLNSVFKQLEDINTALGQSEAEYISKETLFKQAEKDGPGSLPQVLTSTLINDLKSEYAKHRSEYEQLSETFHEDYPDVKTIKSRMNSIEARINSESQKIFDSIKYDYLSAKSKLDSLRTNMEQKKKQALDLNERATQYTIMTREVETNKAIYQSLLERAKEIESMAGISPSNIQIVDKASLPIFPAKPNVPRNLMLAIILGLMGGVGAAFAMEYFADTITNPEQIPDRFQIPILGVLPLEASSSEYPVERIFSKNPQASMSEALRTLRVSIQLSGSGANSKCIAITSTSSGEGKTTITANLAQAFAGAGEKVLLIDADLRKPRLHKIFQAASAANDGRGLSSFLAGVVNDGFIAKTSVENLYLIPSGPIPPNPVELLASNRFSQLIAKSSEEFDRILLDSPPHLGFADVLVLSRQVGGVILVSGIGETTRDGIRHFKKSIHNVQGAILGCIVNKINLSQRYGYRSYYRYYKAYNYEYGTKNKDLELKINPLQSDLFNS